MGCCCEKKTQSPSTSAKQAPYAGYLGNKSGEVPIGHTKSG